jgi:erythromycin esterase-like protein
LLPVGTVARAQERTAQSIVDGVVNAVCQKQIVLLGELPTHGEAHTFDAKSKIADRLIAQCGFTAILFEAAIYDFIGLERAAETRTATPEQLDNAIGRFWWTRELTPWRRALFEAATRQRVVVGGLDDQVSITSHYAKAALPRLIAAASSEAPRRSAGKLSAVTWAGRMTPRTLSMNENGCGCNSARATRRLLPRQTDHSTRRTASCWRALPDMPTASAWA